MRRPHSQTHSPAGADPEESLVFIRERAASAATHSQRPVFPPCEVERLLLLVPVLIIEILAKDLPKN
jgi:hypothetical protein